MCVFCETRSLYEAVGLQRKWKSGHYLYFSLFYLQLSPISFISCPQSQLLAPNLIYFFRCELELILNLCLLDCMLCCLLFLWMVDSPLQASEFQKCCLLLLVGWNSSASFLSIPICLPTIFHPQLY